VQEATLTVRHKVGLHARPAAVFVQTAKQFKSQVLVTKDGREVDAKSVLGILTLGAGKGAVVTIRADGEDEAEAVAALKQLVDGNFGEEE
jgi:phosphocarrier protein HPr